MNISLMTLVFDDNEKMASLYRNIPMPKKKNLTIKREIFFYKLPYRGSINRKMKEPRRKRAWY